jgi:hypothetical protein
MFGTGRDDYLYVDPKTGATLMYRNPGYDPTTKIGWQPWGTIATGIGDGAGVIFAGKITTP